MTATWAIDHSAVPVVLLRQMIAYSLLESNDPESPSMLHISRVAVAIIELDANPPTRPLAWRFHGDLSSSRVKTEEGCSDLR